MRHRVGQRKLGRVTEHRIAMLRNQAERLIHYEHLQTTVPKAKELRPFVERIITIAPRFEARPGGYTRILRLGHRQGDSADVAQIELVGSEYNPNAEAEKKTAAEGQPKAKGVGGRLRAAADRLRGKGKAEGEEGAEGTEAPKTKAKPSHRHEHGPKADTRGKGAKTTTPRKAGGS
jgi:large subunit ribosomal protein L17